MIFLSVTGNIKYSLLSTQQSPHAARKQLSRHTPSFHSGTRDGAGPQRNLCTSTRTSKQPTSNWEISSQTVNPAKARAHPPSYICMGAFLPTIRDQPVQVSEDTTEQRNLQKLVHYYLFPLFISNLVCVYFPFLL